MESPLPPGVPAEAAAPRVSELLGLHREGGSWRWSDGASTVLTAMGPRSTGAGSALWQHQQQDPLCPLRPQLPQTAALLSSQLARPDWNPGSPCHAQATGIDKLKFFDEVPTLATRSAEVSVAMPCIHMAGPEPEPSPQYKQVEPSVVTSVSAFEADAPLQDQAILPAVTRLMPRGKAKARANPSDTRRQLLYPLSASRSVSPFQIKSADDLDAAVLAEKHRGTAAGATDPRPTEGLAPSPRWHLLESKPEPEGHLAWGPTKDSADDVSACQGFFAAGEVSKEASLGPRSTDRGWLDQTASSLRTLSEIVAAVRQEVTSPGSRAEHESDSSPSCWRSQPVAASRACAVCVGLRP